MRSPSGFLASAPLHPAPLRERDVVGGVRITERVSLAPPMYRFHGTDGSRSYLIKQFAGLRCETFLRWQNEARFALLPEQKGYLWPCKEWEGGMIVPRPRARVLALQPELLESPDTVLALARTLVGLLVRLHGLGIAHLRLSPNTVRYKHDRGSLPGVVYLSNFSIARLLHRDDYWFDSCPPGYDPAWAAPETLRGIRGTPKTDVFCFGALLSWLLTGIPPFGMVRSFMREFVVSGLSPAPHILERKRSGIPPELVMLALACMAPEPDERPEMAEVAHLLGAPVEDGRVGPRGIPKDDELGSEASAEKGRGVEVLQNDEGEGIRIGDKPATSTPTQKDQKGAVRRSGAGDISSGDALSQKRADKGNVTGQAVGSRGFVSGADKGQPASSEPSQPQRIMVFVGRDEAGPELFDRALHIAEERESLLLFVGLVPSAPPGLAIERFKAGLFANLGDGLYRCRRKGVEYGLRMQANVSQSRAAATLVQRYEPDRILVGPPTTGRFFPGRITAKLRRMGAPVEEIRMNR